MYVLHYVRDLARAGLSRLKPWENSVYVIHIVRDLVRPSNWGMRRGSGSRGVDRFLFETYIA